MSISTIGFKSFEDNNSFIHEDNLMQLYYQTYQKSPQGWN